MQPELQVLALPHLWARHGNAKEQMRDRRGGVITQSNRRGREILWVYDRRRERMDWRKGLKQIQIRVLRGGWCRCKGRVKICGFRVMTLGKVRDRLRLRHVT